jgi:hypothetical protein
MASDSERFQHIIEALNTDVIQTQLASWKEQRDLLRQTMLEMWNEEDQNGSQFKSWWSKIQPDVRTAVVCTALEDLPNGFSFASLSTVVCPEIMEVEDLLKENGQKILSMLDLLIDDSENTEHAFSTAIFSEVFNSEKQSSTALNALKLARSCILLQFGISILLLFNSQKDEVQHRIP